MLLAAQQLVVPQRQRRGIFIAPRRLVVAKLRRSEMCQMYPTELEKQLPTGYKHHAPTELSGIVIFYCVTTDAITLSKAVSILSAKSCSI